MSPASLSSKKIQWKNKTPTEQPLRQLPGFLGPSVVLCTVDSIAGFNIELLEEDWSSAKYCETFETLSEKLTRDNIERMDTSKITVEEFAENYESRHVPVVLTVRLHVGPRLENGQFLRRRTFREIENDFLEYMRETVDDSPLYIFDSTFGEQYKVRRLLEDYHVPHFFADDLFRYASENRRPPYRWFLIGSSRSGTGLHVDPSGTSAWNALVKGCKNIVYGRISSPNWLKQWRPIEAMQYPGEVIFVPGGWWHVVLNLTDTVVVTQNFCFKVNLPLVLLKTLARRPKFCQHWLKCLRKTRPDILPIIDGVLKNVDVFINFAESSSNDSGSSTESSDSESESPNPPLQQYPSSMRSTTITEGSTAFIGFLSTRSVKDIRILYA
uniref:JmjC domain-containing protein n=1 Tax=Wuchereria bancrofti TaxID=6293 RepID=A0AAF5PGF7_WUCBA